MTEQPHTETLAYEAGGQVCRSYFASASGNQQDRPGILVFPEWWGMNDYARRRADMLAELGFNALAVDMYGNGAVAANPDEAGQLMNSVLGDMENTGTPRIAGALAALKAQPQVGSKAAAIGYCMGGAMVLHAARLGMDLRAVVSFHGALGSFHTPSVGSVKTKILVCHGASDVLVPDDDVAAFKQEMDSAEADYTFTAYEGALHGFTNPEATAKGEKYGLPLAYSESVDQQSWGDMLAFLSQALA